MRQNMFFLFLLTLFFTSCNENTLQIPCVSCDVDEVPVEDEEKKILIEEFTGVRCVQCPGGSAELENLLDIHRERVVVVSIHAGPLTTPYDDGNDFRTEEGEALMAFLDFPEGFPTAVINRKRFENETTLQLGRTTWPGYVTAEKELLSDIILDLALDYNPSTRELIAKTSIQPLRTISENTHLSIMILETDIVGHQEAPEGFKEDYVHKHVLRDMLTPFDGEPITESLTADASIEKRHNIILPSDWDSNNISVVVFVHGEGSNREILQVEQMKLTE